MKSVGRGVALSMLSTLNCDVARPISDWRWDLLQNDTERQIMVDHYTKLKALDVKYVKEMDDIETQRKQEMEQVLRVKLFDESQYDNKIVARAKEIESLEKELADLQSNPVIFKAKSTTKKRRMLTSKAAKRNDEARAIELQRVLLQDRNHARDEEKRLGDFQMEKRAELMQARQATTEIEKLVAESEKELASIRAISARNATQGESEKVRRKEIEEEAEMAHYRAIEEHTKKHLDRLRGLTDTPGWQIRTHQLFNKALLTLTIIIAAVSLPGWYSLLSCMLRCHGTALDFQKAFTKKSDDLWAQIVDGVKKGAAMIA